MPVSKRAALASKRGGDLPSDPKSLQKTAEAAPESTVEPVKLTPGVVCLGLKVTVKSCTKKDSNFPGKNSKTPKKYYSCVGTASGRTYWWSRSIEELALNPGEMVRISGTIGKPFGGEKKPIHPIKKISEFSIYRIEEVETAQNKETAQKAKVSQPTADNLVKTITKLVSEHGVAPLFRALAVVLDPKT